MTKYYISKVVGDGSEANPFRAKLHDYKHKRISRTCKDGDTWCLCTVIANDHTLWENDSDIAEITTKNKILDLISSFNIDGLLVGQTDDVDKVIEKIGKLQEPKFRKK